VALLLTGSDVRACLDFGSVIDAVERIHIAHAHGGAQQGARTGLPLPQSAGTVFTAPAVSASIGMASVKVMSDLPGNSAKHLPTQQSVLLLLDAKMGRCVAILDGSAVTAVRTAAASAVATRLLARPESTKLGLIGAGRLARTHVQAIRAVRPISSVAVWSRRAGTALAFAAEIAEDGLEVRVAAFPEEAVRGADVVCTLTPSRVPLVFGDWLEPGMHLNVVGSPPRLDHRELDGAAIARARVFVDEREAVTSESGDLMTACAEGFITRDHFADEIGEVAAGLKAGREHPEQVTLFKSVGLGIQDLGAADLAVTRARQLGLGVELVL
jgi:alanine dehydrogenase